MSIIARLFRRRRGPRPPFRVVGMGPFPIPGERRRRERAHREARRMLAVAETPEGHPWFERCEHGVQFLDQCGACPGGCPQVGER